MKVWDFRAQRRSALLMWQWCVILIPFWTRCARWLLHQEPTDRRTRMERRSQFSFSCSFLSSLTPTLIFISLRLSNGSLTYCTVYPSVYLKQIINLVRSTKHNCFRSSAVAEMRHALASSDKFSFQEDADPLFTWFCLLVELAALILFPPWPPRITQSLLPPDGLLMTFPCLLLLSGNHEDASHIAGIAMSLSAIPT